MPTPSVIAVVTCFLTKDKEVLVLKRSDQVRSYRGCWAGVSGSIEAESPVERAWIELSEELGITPNDAVLEREGTPFPVIDDNAGRHYHVHPFRFSIAPKTPIRLDWEHVTYKWIRPERIPSLQTVPALFDAWKNVSD